MLLPHYIRTGGFAPVQDINVPAASIGVMQRVSEITFFCLAHKHLKPLQTMNLPYFDHETDATLLTSEELYSAVENTIEEAMILNRVYYDRDDLQQAVDELTPEIVKIITTPRFAHIQHDIAEFTEFITYLAVKMG